MNVIVTARQQACADESSMLVSGLCLRRQLCVWFVACVHVLHLHAGQRTAGTACWMWTLHQKSKPRVRRLLAMHISNHEPLRTHTHAVRHGHKQARGTHTHTHLHIFYPLFASSWQRRGTCSLSCIANAVQVWRHIVHQSRLLPASTGFGRNALHLVSISRFPSHTTLS